MLRVGLALAALFLGAAAPAPGKPASWILRCDIPQPAKAGPAASGPRTLRIAPKVLQEWNPTDKKFGPNLCDSFQCRWAARRLEGTLTSASLMVTVQVDASRKRASWRTQGASGLKKTSGSCSVEPETGSTRLG